MCLVDRFPHLVLLCVLVFSLTLPLSPTYSAEPLDNKDEKTLLKELDSAALGILERSYERQRSRAVVTGRPESRRTEGSITPEQSSRVAPPDGAADHPGAVETMSVNMEPVTLKRWEKAPVGSKESLPETPSEAVNWQQLSFSSGIYDIHPGLDPALGASVSTVSDSGKMQDRDAVYAFLLMDEYLSPVTAQEITALGVEILGPHSECYKIKIPRDSNTLDRLMDLPYVIWAGFSLKEQKIDTVLKPVMAGDRAGSVDELPVMINLFDQDTDNTFSTILEDAGAVLGAYDMELMSYEAVVTREEIDLISDHDFVLFIELILSDSPSHSQSMAMVGADYIRASGTAYDGSSTILGICDTGFMLGNAAATPHSDLGRWGCGKNFTTDAAGVWNDEDTHGSHVLGTILGQGVGNIVNRGVALGIAGSASTSLRAAKIWDSTGSSPSSSWMTSAMDYMDDSSDCSGDSTRPMVVNISGGAYGGSALSGTDTRSRKLDGKVWTYDQLYVMAAGNDGSGSRTVGAPAVAKNALAVGNVMDYNVYTVGDIWSSSSRGPAADGRMKPNLCAPGRTVTSVAAGTANGYMDKWGTSMAAPHVSGIAATLMEHYSGLTWNPALMRAHLMASTLLHNDDDYWIGNTYGMGRLSSYLAHWAHDGSNGWSTHWSSTDIDMFQYKYMDVTVPSGTDRLVVVLTWDEPAASSGAADAVDYNLDLYIDRGADCGSGNCGEYSSTSTIDNVEYRIIDNPPSGTYRLKVYPTVAPSFLSSPSSLPYGMAAVVIQGDPSPDISFTGWASTSTPCKGNTFTITTSVYNPSFIASGVHLEMTGMSSGLTLTGVSTTREDGVSMNFGTASQLTLGNIRAGDSRWVTWTFRMDTTGSKSVNFRAWSENGGTRTRTVSVDGITTPAAPAGISYSSTNCGTNFYIDWPTSSMATSYVLEEDTNSSFTTPTTIYSGSSSLYYRSARPIGNYYYRVKALNSCGTSSYRTGTLMRVYGNPSTPSSLTYPATNYCGNFRVDWPITGNATSYRLQRDTDSSFSSPTTVYTGGTSHYDESGLSNGSYYYRVRAENACFESAYRSASRIQVRSNPSVPDSLGYPSTDCDGTFTISWAEADGADSYVLQRDNNTSFSSPHTVYTGSSLQYNQSGLGSGNYYYRVRSENSCATSAFRTGTSMKVIGVPGRPSEIDYPQTACDNSGFSVQWPSVNGAATYTLQRDTSSSFSNPVAVYTDSASTFHQPALAAGSYYYRVRANNTCYSSSYRSGGAVEVISSPARPMAISYPVRNAKGEFMVKWPTVVGASIYRLQRANNASFNNAVTLYSGANSYYNQSGLADGSYMYRVRAQNDCGNSSYQEGPVMEVGPFQPISPVLEILLSNGE